MEQKLFANLSQTAQSPVGICWVTSASSPSFLLPAAVLALVCDTFLSVSVLLVAFSPLTPSKYRKFAKVINHSFIFLKATWFVPNLNKWFSWNDFGSPWGFLKCFLLFQCIIHSMQAYLCQIWVVQWQVWLLLWLLLPPQLWVFLSW